MQVRYLLLCAIILCLLPLRSEAADSTIPLYFTKNLGQWPDSILFRASAGNTTLWLTKDGIHYQVTQLVRPPQTRPGERPDSVQVRMVKAQFAGANPQVQLIGLDEQACHSNYFLGHDPARWRTNVPNYSAVRYENIYPGVSATFRGDHGKLSYELHGSAAALAQVRTTYHGADDIPFQGMLPASDASKSSAASSTSLGNVTLFYSTYLGGTDNDYVVGLAVDTGGCAYVSGLTFSANFPVHLSYQPYQGTSGYGDVFVTKLSASGNSPVYSTYLGGTKDDVGWAIAVDKQGSPYLTGKTYSTDFPTRSAYQPLNAGYYDAFVAKLAPTGDSLVYGTYLGGDETDEGFGVAVDTAGYAYIAGRTYSGNFPTLSPYQTEPGDANWDAWVTKISPAGNTLAFSTYLGGSNYDEASAIAVDDSGYTYITGSTSSDNFPTQSPIFPRQASRDVFVAKLAISGAGLVYSTYLGGSDADNGYAIALDKAGCAYVAGETFSTDFPSQNPYQTDQGSDDAFVTKLSAAGTSLLFSTYLGGSGSDAGHGLTVDTSGNVVVTGYTGSTNFPVQLSFQPDQLLDDAFVTKLSPSGNSIIASTYLGGGDNDYGRAVKLDKYQNVYVAGYTASDDFPTLTPYQTYQGSIYHYDGFVTKLNFGCCIGVRGNVDLRGIIDLTDLSWLIDYLTRVPRITLPCPDAANIDGLGVIDLTDLSWLITYLTVVPPLTLPNCP